ncbi:MAG TPA: ATP-dependent DNA helicase [Steroidobacteraceae bacterium]|nr:ATP-dependent DNA helicase [Steroidobacteraceae bacterium]
MTEIEAVLGAAGPLTRALAGFKPRPMQQRMAARIQSALRARDVLLLEAGTGTGKTYAYLVPALLSGLRVLISTGTRTLQDQLFHRDLPLLAGAIGRPARIALLKGRSNYLCRSRLLGVGQQAELLPALADRAAQEAPLARALAWARVSATGDLSELTELGEEHPVRAQLSSTRESCTGARCEQYARCHVFAARHAAMQADIVVVNHHLLLADMALKEDGFGDLLPSVDAVILDEAHQLPDLASEFFGVSLSARQIELLLADLRQQLRGAARGAAPAPSAPSAPGASSAARPLMEAVAGALQMTHAALGRLERQLAWRDLPAAASRGLEQLGEALAALGEHLGAAAGGSAELQSGAARVAGQAEALRQILTQDTTGARTVTCDARGFALRLLPYDIAPRFRAFMQQGSSAWIFTSATLAVGGDFSHFAGRLGLTTASSLSLPSPFDYERQALMYLPEGMPDPAEAGFTAALLEAALPLIQASGGGAFLLFTSLRALRQAATLLAERLAASLPLLVQGSAPREQLLRRFRASGEAVLLGSASFWEGVDVQGPALRLVVIDRLPFASPEDPVVRARIEHLQTQGASPFRDYQLPEAVLALKQGVGRLIRSEHDAGVIMIGDPRLTARAYGRLFRESLPPMPVTREAAVACARLSEAARTLPRTPQTASAP